MARKLALDEGLQDPYQCLDEFHEARRLIAVGINPYEESEVGYGGTRYTRVSYSPSPSFDKRPRFDFDRFRSLIAGNTLQPNVIGAHTELKRSILRQCGYHSLGRVPLKDAGVGEVGRAFKERYTAYQASRRVPA